MENSGNLFVTLLGGFSLHRLVDGKKLTLNERGSGSRRLWTFLQYLSVFHQRPVSQSELIEVLWGDEEGSSDPANAMKTLLHRSRATMEQLGYPSGKDVILYKHGFYSWGEGIELDLDAERFDALCAQADENVESAMQAIELYSGDFLPNATGSPWAVSMRTYYHTKYLKLCNETVAVLSQQDRHEDVITICRKATEIDPYDEASHLLLMQALAASGAQQVAIQHYSRVADMFMNQLGVAPSDEMVQLYRMLSKAERHIELDLRTVRKKLEENPMGRGAYFCEYATFQDIYHLEARSVQRSGSIVQLAMVTVTDTDGKPLDNKRCSAISEELRKVIQRCLRAGDSFTRFSAAQYLILLPTASYENGIKALQRVLSIFDKTPAGMTSRVQYSLLPVLPTGEDERDRARFVPVAQDR